MIDLDLHLQRPHQTLNIRGQLSQRVTGLFGPSGAGKTTLLHMIGGLITPTHGRIVINGETLFDSSRRINLPPHHRRVGLVFQQPRLLPHRSVWQNLTYPLRFNRHRSRVSGEISGEEVVKLLELKGLLKHRPHQLSGGEAQRVSVGRALLSQPRVLLLDEPMTGLDHRLRQQIAPLLQRVRDELDIPMIYVAHDLGELLRFTDTLAVIDQGTLIGCGRYIDLSLDPRILERVLPTGLVNVLPMQLIEHDVEGGTSVLRSGDLELRSRLLHDMPIGSRVSVSIRPEDIAISIAPLEGVSIRNQFPATVARHTQHQGVILVELKVGCDTPLLVEVSPGSFKRLGLSEGKHLTALVKSNALRVTLINPDFPYDLCVSMQR